MTDPNAQSRRHLSVILRQTLLVAAICLPPAIATDHPLTEYLVLLRATFGFSSVVVVIAASLSRARLTPAQLCIWDHAAMLLLLKLACALVLDSLA